MANTKWDVLDKHPEITVSGAGLIATSSTASGVKGIRNIDGKSAGKFVASVTVGGNTGADTCIAIATRGTYWSDVSSNDRNAVVCYANFQIYFNGSSTPYSLGFTAGDIIDVAADFDNSRVWFRKNGGNWNGNGAANPDTNTNGIDISSINGHPWFLQIGSDVAASATFTVNFGDTAFPYTMPSSFTGWTSNNATPGDTFDSASKTTDITLLNGDLTVHAGTATTSSRFIRTINNLPNDKRYFEYFSNTAPNSCLGLADGSAVSGTFYPNNATHGAALIQSLPSLAYAYVNNVEQTHVNAFSDGHIICIAVDKPNDKFWVRIGAFGWIGTGTPDPATSTGGFDLSSIGPDFFAAVGGPNGGPMEISLNSSSIGKLTPPTGYNVGLPAAASVVETQQSAVTIIT